MKYHYCIFLLVFSIQCTAQVKELPDQVPYGENPATPSQALLDKLLLISFDSLTEEVLKAKDGSIIRTFSLDQKPYSGWAIQVFPDTHHRYRYTKYEAGLPVWQIGYYDNGRLDHDFHMKGGQNYGSQRMWRGDGSPYIDTYFAEGGIQHGPQKRWYDNGILARDAQFQHGELVYEVLWNKDGKITEEKGMVPIGVQDQR